jgi:hypothetical protein
MRFRPVLFGVMVTVTCGGFFACGSRTALPGDFDAVNGGNDDSGSDARKPRDAGPDTAIPPIDARPPFDASRLDCPDASATLIYLVTTANELLSFYPPSASFTLIGNLACPDANIVNGALATPFSMAVDRRGTAYVEFNDGNLFKVDTATAACAATPFVADQGGFTNFGMGFATIGSGPAEQLFIAGDVDPQTSTGIPDFGSIDVKSFLVSDIGNFNPPINNAELTGTGDGRLFGFWTDPDTEVTSISEIDKTNGNIVGSDILPGVTVGTAWAFGYWGGNFYTFTAQQSQPSAVTEFNPNDKSVNVIAGYPNQIVGAGVSTCAPQ